MFNRLAALSRISVAPYRYRQCVESDSRFFLPHTMVSVVLRQGDRTLECVKCEWHRAEAMGHILWRAHVDESGSVSDFGYEVAISAKSSHSRRRVMR